MHSFNLFTLLKIVLPINIVLVILVRTIYRYVVINKYHYDYYDSYKQKKSKLFKLSINFYETIKKLDNLVFVLLMLILEAIMFYIITQ